MYSRSGEGGLFDGFDVDAYLEGVAATAKDESAQRADIAIVAAPGEGDVITAGFTVVGGVDVEPERAAIAWFRIGHV